MCKSRKKLIFSLALSLAIIPMYSITAQAAGSANPAQDSTNIPRPTGGSTFYVDTSGSSPNVSNEDYSSLASCPRPPSNCPDINGRCPNGTCTPSTCPDACVARKAFVPGGNYGYWSMWGYITPTPAIPLPGSLGTNFQCPSGYSSVNTFGSGPEYAYVASPPAVSLNTSALFNNMVFYQNAGYTCGPDGVQRYSPTNSQTYCHDNFGDSRISASPFVAFYTADGIRFVTSQPAYVNWASANYYSCHGSCLGCAPGWGHDNWQIGYQYVQCRPPGGVYPTGGMTPYNQVCVRHKTVWRQTR